ncbi:MAG: hypothetical protein JKY48_01405 [Flavobacteriales bacterium]|nr:hypothetical protein [Flavobacteriales bacterium]
MALSKKRRDEYFWENGTDVLTEDNLSDLVEIIKLKDLKGFKLLCSTIHMDIDEIIEQEIEDGKENAYIDDYDRYGVKRSDFS